MPMIVSLSEFSNMDKKFLDTIDTFFDKTIAGAGILPNSRSVSASSSVSLSVSLSVSADEGKDVRD